LKSDLGRGDSNKQNNAFSGIDGSSEGGARDKFSNSQVNRKIDVKKMNKLNRNSGVKMKIPHDVIKMFATNDDLTPAEKLIILNEINDITDEKKIANFNSAKVI
jgi:hypothetical protein